MCRRGSATRRQCDYAPRPLVCLGRLLSDCRTRFGSSHPTGPPIFSNGENYDAYISAAEVAEANSYDPSGDWGLTTRLVGTVFGEHSLYSISRTPAFQSQTLRRRTPDDGVITKGTWTYQLNTTLDNVPVGGWGHPQIAAPTTPTGLLSMAKNVVRAYSIHTGTVDPPTATVSFDFIPTQQGNTPRSTCS